jgi:hypothetical protein
VNNKIYAIGGQPAELFILTSSIEEYEPPQKGSIAVRQVSDSRLPEDFILEQNYPNPFNPSTTIKYALPQSLVVRLSVYDLLGREVSAIVNERRDAGVHEVKFDGSNFVSGVYFYRLQAGTYTKTKKLTVLK